MDQRDIRLQVRGKGKSGKAIPQKAAIPWFDTLWMLFERAMAREPLDVDRCSQASAGQAHHVGGNGFTELLKAAGWSGIIGDQAHAVLAQALLHQRAASQWLRGARCSSQLPSAHLWL